MRARSLVIALLLLPTASESTAAARPKVAPPVSLVAKALRVDTTPGAPLDAEGRAVARDAGRRLLSLCPDCRLSTIAEEGPCGWARTNRVLIRNAVALGMSEDAIVKTYVETYGPDILAIQTNRGWAATSWIVPFSLISLSLLLLLGLGYRMTKSSPMPGSPTSPSAAAEGPNEGDTVARAILNAELDELD